MTGIGTGVRTDAVLTALASAVGEAEGAGRLAVLRSQSRRRSELWFVGVRGERTCRWVVKRPHPGSWQEDLGSPLTSAEQLHALERLQAHLVASGSAIRVPRPLAALPEVDAYVMEYVDGSPVSGLIGPRALLAGSRLLDGVATCAGVLRVVHAVPAEDEPVLPLPDTTASGARPEPVVVLHGDFAPENVLLSGTSVFCLDPGLSHRGRAEVDVVRYLTMLFDAPAFVLGVGSARTQRLRRRAAATFLAAYYGDHGPPADLVDLLAVSLEARWRTRHSDVLARQPAHAGARARLLERYFSLLLTDVREQRAFTAP